MTQTEELEEENLATGWESDAPVDDTILRQFLFNQAAMSTAIVRGGNGKILERDDLIAIDLGRPATLVNNAILLRPLDPGAIESTLAELTSFFDFDGEARGMVVLVSAWPTPDLRPFGWRLMGHPPIHLRAPFGEAPAEPVGVRIEAVRNADQLWELERTAIDAYPLEEMQPAWRGSLFRAPLLDDRSFRAWIAYRENEPVGVSTAYVDQGVVNVAFVATLPEARGTGIGAALTWRATLAQPELPALLLSSDEGRSVYLKMGFLPVLRMTFWYRNRD